MGIKRTGNRDNEFYQIQVELQRVDEILDSISAGGYQSQDDKLDDIAALTDPNDDRLLSWDDSAGEITWTDPAGSILLVSNLLALDGDNATPGNSKYYGTNGSGTKGFYDLPVPGAGGITAVVDDTTPQLGGDLDANSFDIDMGTNVITDAKVGEWDTAFLLPNLFSEITTQLERLDAQQNLGLHIIDGGTF